MPVARAKILYTIAWMEVGGSQTHLLQVLKLLDRERFEPLVYCWTGRGALLNRVRDLDVPVLTGDLEHGFRSMGMVAAMARFVRLLRREKVDIVHNYLLRANIFGSVGARLARVPVVLCSKRGCHERRGLELLGARLSNRLADCVPTNADAVREFVHGNEGCPKEKMVVIPSGVDTERFRPLPGREAKTRLGLDPERPVVGVVTRMRVRKGVEEFLQAMAVVCRRVPGTQTVIVGEVELDQELAAIVSEGGFGDDFHLLGRRRDMPEVFAAFDVFVLSSHDEGMSNAILEAMAAERPVVATDVGGTGEVVRDGRSGILVPAKDPAPLAEAIAVLLESQDRAAEMGRLGRRIVDEDFSAKSMVRQMERLYLKLLDRRGRLGAGPAQAAA